ncbi:MAG: CoA transferase [Rhodobiaceae bacterium]|nr:MAG: CoA transferase [Rhodobiaceae bacterium]
MGTNEATLQQPLKGIRVVEFSTMITASLATMILAAQGAEVIKVEPVGIGDVMRFIGSQKKGISALFANCNRGKRSLAVNLKDPAGQEMVQRLVADADVLVHNYRAGVMDRLNLGSERLRQANANLIYVALTGFGKTGPKMHDPAYDHVIQALTGYTGVQADGSGPQFMKTVVADKITAYTTCQGITAALLARATTGVGQHIDISMLQASLFFLWPDGMMNETLLADDVTQFVPMADYYQTSATLDGHISIAAATDGHWQGVCKVIGRPEIMEDPRFNSIFARSANFAVLLSEIAGAFEHMTTREALAALSACDVPCGECLTPAGVIENSQVNAVGALGTQEHPLLGPLRTAMPPVQFEGVQHDIERPCPAHGEHSAEIARELGLEAGDIAALVEAGTLSTA